MAYNDLKSNQLLELKTIQDLKNAGYQSKTIKEELRDNLIYSLQNNGNPFKGIHGYEQTVIPDIERAILSRHNINLLGLRGQAKTRIARLMVGLLDEYIPIVTGSELNDDPLRPLSRQAKDLIDEKGDNTGIEWLHRNERYTEKLATPDVTVSDLIGDVDPIRAANLKLNYSDERVINFGLIPRSHRCIFVINELPDLQARIQVALFNILQEGDIQIRGFKLRLPLDIQFVFTANPEDYTNRGSIVTPLKDRIGSQIITHYPTTLETSKKITHQESRLATEQKQKIKVGEIAIDLVEQISFVARESEYVDEKSGVSARLTISAYENLVSAAERRMLINNEKSTFVRMSDFRGVVPAIAGKIELVYEGEQEGAGIVAESLINKSIREQFLKFFPDPEKQKKLKEDGLYYMMLKWFGDGNTVDIMNDASQKEYEKQLKQVPLLEKIVAQKHPKAEGDERLFLMEFLLHGLAEYSALNKNVLANGLVFKDLFSSMFSMPEADDDDEFDEY